MIYIVRHGETDWNTLKKLTGQTDISLNLNGINQANNVKEELKDIKFDYDFSSPLKRAYDTAKIITNEEIIVDDRLMERYNGLLEGKTKSELDLLDKNDPKYNVERTESLHERAESFINDLKKYKGNILIVTHAGISINLRILLEGDTNDISKYRMKNCEVVRINNEW